jgi:hypothetical protein
MREPTGELWTQFRRLLLGTVVEALLEADVAIDFRSLEIRFDSESDFRVPRLDNYMRFKGLLAAQLSGDPPTSQIERQIDTKLQTVWPAILRVADIPIGDKLTIERNDIAVRIVGSKLEVRFDLEAD